jgi:fructokinase/2-dehydro-3-deoxygluconokinase
MAKPVVVIGDINVDMVFRQLGQEGRAPFDLEVRGGGTTANTAVALAHLGWPVEFLGAVGDDGYGRFLREDLSKEGVGATHLRVNENTSSLAILFVVDERGEIIWGTQAWPRSMDELAMRLRPEEIDPALIRGAAWLHTSGTAFLIKEFRSGALFAMELAQDAGVPVSLDINVRQEWLTEPFWEALQKGIELSDVVLGSADDELPLLEPDTPFQEIARHISAGKRVCVARMGAKGSMAISPEGEAQVDAYTVDVEDVVGAGDTYNAGFITAQLEGLSLADSQRMGGAVAALTISRPGTRHSPTRQEVRAFIQENEIKG